MRHHLPPSLFRALLLVLSCLPGLPANAAPPQTLQGVHRLVTLGDSITQLGGRPGGYVWLMQHYPEVLYPGNQLQVINAGISGHRSNDMLSRFRKDVVDQGANLVTISVGINDVWHGFQDNHPAGDGPKGIPLTDFRQNVEHMAAIARQAGIQVVLFTPTIFEDSPDSPRNTRLKSYVEAIRQIAREQHLILADQNAAFVQAWQVPGPPDHPRLTVDQVHLSPAGDALMARTALLALGIPARDLDAAGPRVNEALKAEQAEVAARQAPANPVDIRERKTWDILSTPPGGWDIEHPEWLAAAAEGEALSLAFTFPASGARNWNTYRAWAGRRIPPGSLGQYDGLTFEARAETPSATWTVDILLIEDDGSIYVHRATVTPDRGSWVRGYALFKDFTLGPWIKSGKGLVEELSAGSFYHDLGDFTADVENNHLDLDRVVSIQFGTIHRQGGGNTLAIRGMELIKVNGPAAPPVDQVLEFRVDPEHNLVVNGQGSIPDGIFGLHLPSAAALDDPGILAAAKDLRPGYLRTLHTDGEGSRDIARLSVFQPNTLEAKLLHGMGITDWVLGIRGADRPPANDDAWAWAVTGDLARYVRNAPRDAIPPRLEVWNEPDHAYALTRGDLTPVVHTVLNDPDAMGYLLGPVARDIYESIYTTTYREVRAGLPEVQVGGFSLDPPDEEDWNLWEIWWRPLMDHLTDQYDFLTEHHYGATGAGYQAGLMLLAAYNIARRGRIVPVYNTEAGAAFGDQVERINNPDFDWWVADYEIQDILTMLREPDKVHARAAHLYPTFFAKGGAVGDPAQRRPLYWAHWTLRDLRGLRLSVAPAWFGDVEMVASADGDHVVMALYNHSDEPRHIHLLAPAPRGAQYSAATERRFGYDHKAKQLVLEKGADSHLTGATFDTTTVLAGRTLVVYTLAVSHHNPPAQQWEIGDAFADRFFLELYPGRAQTMRVYLPDMKGVQVAELVLAMQSAAYGAGGALVNGHLLSLPFSSANPRQAAIHSLRLDPAWLKTGANELTIIHNGVPGAGPFRLLAASIRTERETRAARPGP